MENSLTTNIFWVESSGGPMQKILGRNANELAKLVDSNIQISKRHILVVSKRPVVVRAKIETLMKQKKMNRGFVTQYLNCVVYEPSKTSRDNYYKS